MGNDCSTARGFTIVELLVVVVVIAILAAVTAVGFTGIRERAQAAALASSLREVDDKIRLYAIENGDTFPDDLAAVGILDGDDVTYQYTSNNAASPRQYCVTATYRQEASSYISSSGTAQQEEGICPGHNLLVWYKSVSGAPAPVSAATIDTTVFRSGDRSMRLAPSQVGLGLRISPLSVTQGETYTVSLWIRTDSGWNGLANNSKIRFGNLSGGGLLAACGYNGVKLSWTYVTCSYTVAAGVTGLTVSVGNDGTVGSIWIDDLSVSVAPAIVDL